MGYDYEGAIEEMRRRVELEDVMEACGRPELADQSRAERMFAAGVVARLAGVTRSKVLADVGGGL